jgi:hypothetical protein
MPKIELFNYWKSSCSWRVRIALAWKASLLCALETMFESPQTTDLRPHFALLIRLGKDKPNGNVMEARKGDSV